ncbi:MAG: response regulator [Desulfobacterales bacterium]
MLEKNFPSARSPISILIVDDHESILELLSFGFERQGFTVFKAMNGLEAWNLFNNECINVVFTDMQIPGLNGCELARKIRQHSPLTKIAMTTGGDTVAVTELLKEGTADYFFPKPYNIKSICKIVAAEVETSQPMVVGEAANGREAIDRRGSSSRMS